MKSKSYTNQQSSDSKNLEADFWVGKKITILVCSSLIFIGLLFYFGYQARETSNNLAKILVNTVTKLTPVDSLENLQKVNQISQTTYKCLFIGTKVLYQDVSEICILEAYDLSSVSFGNNFEYLKKLPINKQKLFFYDTKKDLDLIQYLDVSSVFGDQPIENLEISEGGKWQFVVNSQKYESDPKFQNIRKLD